MKAVRSLWKILFAGLISLSSVGAFLGSTAAWFAGKATIDVSDVTGSSVGAYFAGGTGTENNPYILKNKYHVYNLTWLQYLNYFVDGNGNPKQFYFRVDEDIDMGGMAIPPIGNQAYPFIGVFDGNEHVIHNFKVSNYVGSTGITTKPSRGVNSLSGVLYEKDDQNVETVENPVNILGFFGVVGELYDPDGDYSYGSDIPSVSDFSLENFTVQNQAGNVLIGLGAGYVNAELSGVSVGECSFDIRNGSKTLNGYDNLSDYSLVGYCTNDYLSSADIRKAKATQPLVEDGVSGHGGTNYNASIPMKDIYNHLLGVKGTCSDQENTYEYVSTENHYYGTNGQEDATRYTEETTVNNYTSNDYNYPLSGTTLEDSDGNTIASYSFANRKDTDAYLYLYGDDTVTGENNKTVNRYDDHTGYYIYSGGHYLTGATNGTVSDSTNKNTATVWIFENNRLFFINNRQNYYLTSTAAGTLTVTTTQSNTNRWSYDNNSQLYKNGNNLYLGYTNGGWTTNSAVNFSGAPYAISFNYNDATRYLTATTSALGSSTTANYMWYFTGDGASGYPYFKSGNKTYYINYNASVTTSTDYRMSVSGTKIRLQNYNGYCLTYNGNWTYGNTGTNFTFTGSSFSLTANYESRTVTALTSSTSVSSSYETNPTYFPLTFTEDSRDVSPLNTGYIVSGSNYASQPGDIRVSRYAMADILNSLGGMLGDSVAQKIRYGNYYLSVSGTSLTRTNNSGSATTWYVNPLGNIYTLINDVPYFIYGANNQNIGVYFAQYGTYSDSYLASVSDNGTLIHLITYNANSYYLYYNTSYFNSGWTAGTTGTTFNVINHNSYFYNENTAKKMEIITRVAPRSGNSDFDGYVRISDAYNAENVIVAEELSGFPKYDYSTLGLMKYQRARSSFHSTLCEDGGTSIYGLHFMNAEINANHKITADRILANGTEYLYDKNEDINKVYQWEEVENEETGETDFVKSEEYTEGNGKYELPTDCIDFNLSKAGAITFFAGSYFSGNNAFFSLHRIIRNGAKISQILQISKIYLNTKYNSVTNKDAPHYVYKYTNNTYSHAANGTTIAYNTSTDLIFDLDWITNVDDIIEDATYYFEIPVIAGEYALGSVSGRAGAYLMYLDIGAAAESNQITIVTEKVTKDTFSYHYPSGIDFAAIPLANDDYSYVATNGGDVGTVIIPDGVYGTFSFALSGMILTCGPPSGGTITQSTFIGDGASLLCSTSPESTALEAIPVSHTNVVIDSVTTYTYDPFNEVLYTDLETSTTTTVNGVAQTPVDRIYDTVEQSVPEADYTLHKIGLMPGDSDVAFFELYYYCSSAATVDIVCTYTGLYDEEHDTYSYYYVIQVVSDEDITMHIASVLEKPGFDFNITVRRVNSAKTAYEDITDFGEQNTCQIYAGSISGS